MSFSPVEYDKVHYKMGRSKRQKCNDRHFVIIRFFRNSKSCNLSECCLHSFKHSKRYNRAKDLKHVNWLSLPVLNLSVFKCEAC